MGRSLYIPIGKIKAQVELQGADIYGGLTTGLHPGIIVVRLLSRFVFEAELKRTGVLIVSAEVFPIKRGGTNRSLFKTYTVLSISFLYSPPLLWMPCQIDRGVESKDPLEYVFLNVYQNEKFYEHYSE